MGLSGRDRPPRQVMSSVLTILHRTVFISYYTMQTKLQTPMQYKGSVNRAGRHGIPIGQEDRECRCSLELCLPSFGPQQGMERDPCPDVCSVEVVLVASDGSDPSSSHRLVVHKAPPDYLYPIQQKPCPPLLHERGKGGRACRHRVVRDGSRPLPR